MFCWMNWLKADESKNSAAGVGHSSMQHLKVCPVRHIDGIKLDLGSYSWHFCPYFYKARVSKDLSLAATFLLVILDQNFWILVQHFLTQKKKKKKKVHFRIVLYTSWQWVCQELGAGISAVWFLWAALMWTATHVAPESHNEASVLEGKEGRASHTFDILPIPWLLTTEHPWLCSRCLERFSKLPDAPTEYLRQALPRQHIPFIPRRQIQSDDLQCDSPSSFSPNLSTLRKLHSIRHKSYCN